jgi:sugar-specific transcriptional regulator TrmB
MFRDKDVEALTALGLTGLQARVYLALIRLGQAKIQTVSKITQVARQDLYRVMTELQNRCLVEKVLDTAVTFKAVSIQEAVPILLQRLDREKIEAQNKALQLIERHQYKIDKLEQEVESQFLLIPRKEALSRRLNKSIDNAQTSIDFVSPRKTCFQALFDLARG